MTPGSSVSPPPSFHYSVITHIFAWAPWEPMVTGLRPQQAWVISLREAIRAKGLTLTIRPW